VPNEYFGIRVKPGITAFNVFSLFLMTFIVTLCSDDTLSLLQPMLQNKDYYNLTREEATAVVSRGGQINTLPGIIMGIASGYIYDIFGRKKTLIISIVSLGVTYFFFPIFAPNTSLFFVNFAMFSIVISPFSVNPLCTDYVRKESRGKTQGLIHMGLALGTVASLAVLVEFTKNIDPLFAYLYPSSI
jgi:MFS family permease